MRPAGWPGSAGVSSRLLPVLRSTNSRLPLQHVLLLVDDDVAGEQRRIGLGVELGLVAGDATVRCRSVTTAPFLATSRDRREASRRLLRRRRSPARIGGLALVGDVQLGRLKRRVALHGDHAAHEQRRLGGIVDVELLGGHVDRLARVAAEGRRHGRRPSGRRRCRDGRRRCRRRSPRCVSVRMVMAGALHAARRHRPRRPDAWRRCGAPCCRPWRATGAPSGRCWRRSRCRRRARARSWRCRAGRAWP